MYHGATGDFSNSTPPSPGPARPVSAPLPPRLLCSRAKGVARGNDATESGRYSVITLDSARFYDGRARKQGARPPGFQTSCGKHYFIALLV